MNIQTITLGIDEHEKYNHFIDSTTCCLLRRN